MEPFAAAPAAPWGPSYLSSVAARCLERLSAGSQQVAAACADLCSFAPTGHWCWASGCSGTDSPRWVFDSLSSALKERGFDGLQCRHMCSAEKTAAKRQFIDMVASPPLLLGDIFDMSVPEALNHKDGQRCRPIDSMQDLDCLIAGFSCKTVAFINTSSNSVSCSAVWRPDTETGSTLWGVRLAVDRLRPKTLILENVPGLKRNGQAEAIAVMLRQKGYVVILVSLDPEEHFGHPQSRERLYFLAWRNDVVEDAGFTADAVTSLASDIVGSMTSNLAMADIESFLLDDTDPYIVAMKEKRVAQYDEQRTDAGICKAAARQRTPEVARWMTKHRASNKQRSCSSPWDRSMRDEYPDYAILPERCKQLIDALGLAIPHPHARFVTLDQSEVTNMQGCSPAVLPKMLLWLAHRGRLATARELLNLQGIYLPEESPALSAFSENQLADLAGNAFCTPCILGATIVVLAVHARLEMSRQRRCHRRGLMWRPRSVCPVLGLPDSDEDNVDWGSCGDLRKRRRTG